VQLREISLSKGAVSKAVCKKEFCKKLTYCFAGCLVAVFVAMFVFEAVRILVNKTSTNGSYSGEGKEKSCKYIK